MLLQMSAAALEALTGSMSQSLFPSAVAFKDDASYHRDQLSYSCLICGKCFRSKESLMVHRNIHSEAHKCRHCGKGFACRSKLYTHLTTHEPYLKIPCSLCNKAFGGRSELNRHMSVVHRKKDRGSNGEGHKVKM